MQGGGVCEHFYYESKSKIIFWGGGRDGGARVSDFFYFTLNPNLKNIEDIYFFEGNTKIYFIECDENISKFTSA